MNKFVSTNGRFNHGRWLKEFKGGNITEGTKAYELGDMWSNDFDYIGMLKYGAERGFYELGLDALQKLFNSFEDVNYHRESQDLGNAIDWMEDPGKDANQAGERIEDFLARFRKKCASTLDVMGVKWQPNPSIERSMREAINEVDYSTMRLKSNIDQKWDSTDTMLDDMRQFIGASVAASGPDMGKELASALKLLMNFAEGESRG